MIGYQDFLGNKPENEPFRNGMEETLSYLCWVDQLLFSYEYIRELENSDDQDSDGARVRVREELKLGLSYLKQRQEASSQKEVCPAKGMGISCLEKLFGLRDFSFFVFLLALAPQIDDHYTLLYRAVYKKEEGQHGLTFALAIRLYALLLEDEEEIYAKRIREEIERIPVFHLHRNAEADSFLFDRIFLDRTVVCFVKGEYFLEEELEKICGEADTKLLKTPIQARDREVQSLRKIMEDGSKQGAKQLIHLTGKKGSGRKFLLLHARQGKDVLFVHLELLLSKNERQVSEWFSSILLYCRCLGKLLVLECSTVREGDVHTLRGLFKDAYRMVNRVVLISQEVKNTHFLAEEYSYFHLSLKECSGRERLEIWKYYLDRERVDKELDIRMLAGTYRFTPGMIVNCIEQAKSIAVSVGSREIKKEHIQQAVHHFNSSKLSELATHIHSHFGWEDLEIQPEQKKIMQLACARAGLRSVVDEEWGFEQKLSYGRGMSVLLYGPPGTGKTMAAQIMAREIGMELYRVDLSQLVDKYIGETQKNIGRVFDCAREGNFILFFDEADALFSKRTEVQNANDKHANTEINYLLQKVEEYDGITILATNRFDNFDTAFVRRITYTVRLEKPDEAERLRLFQTIMPPQAKREEELDFVFFSRKFELTGSNIKAVLYNAAFMAAAEGKGICNGHIARAIKYEYTKLGKVVTATEFGKYASYV